MTQYVTWRNNDSKDEGLTLMLLCTTLMLLMVKSPWNKIILIILFSKYSVQMGASLLCLGNAMNTRSRIQVFVKWPPKPVVSVTTWREWSITWVKGTNVPLPLVSGDLQPAHIQPMIRQQPFGASAPILRLGHNFYLHEINVKSLFPCHWNIFFSFGDFLSIELSEPLVTSMFLIFPGTFKTDSSRF